MAVWQHLSTELISAGSKNISHHSFFGWFRCKWTWAMWRWNLYAKAVKRKVSKSMRVPLWTIVVMAFASLLLKCWSLAGYFSLRKCRQFQSLVLLVKWVSKPTQLPNPGVPRFNHLEFHSTFLHCFLSWSKFGLNSHFARINKDREPF